MTYFRIDDGFYDHPKVRSIPRGTLRKGAVSLWTFAGSWCGRYLTDGQIPAHQIEELGGTRKEADALVAAVLWHVSGHDCDDCPPVPAGHYMYHQWNKHQDLKADVERKRDTARERMRRLRSGTPPPEEPTAEVRAMFGRTS